MPFLSETTLLWSQLRDLFLLSHVCSVGPFLLIVLFCLSSSPSFHVSLSRADGFMTDAWVLRWWCSISTR